DLGCGSGRAALPLAARGYDVIGVDLSQPMLDRLLDKAQPQPLHQPGSERRPGSEMGSGSEMGPGSERRPGSEMGPVNSATGKIIAVKANLADLNCFVDQAVDHAVCLFSTVGMIQGRKHRQSMLRQVARIVRPGGKLMLHVHNRWAALWEPGGMAGLLRSRLRSWLEANYDFGDKTYAYRGIEEMFMHRFSRSELVRDLTANGWRVEHLHALSIDGSGCLSNSMLAAYRAGGFIVLAQKRDEASGHRSVICPEIGK
ncbi:MAG: class I SAM-dependent methyltransferase, partial [Pirellulales bacterium]|nr:class I SAM-dependent methyltransferase [Pirellulales bacterium]